MGETTAGDIARYFGTIEAVMDADEEALLAVSDVGPVVAASIRRFFAEPHNRDIVAALLDNEATVKTFKRRDGHVWLMPHNPAYAPILGDQATIMGKVVTVLRRV